jgi:hypothetical protein
MDEQLISARTSSDKDTLYLIMTIDNEGTGLYANGPWTKFHLLSPISKGLRVRLNFFTYLHSTPTTTTKKEKKRKEQNANAHFLVVTELLEVHGFGTISEACQTHVFLLIFYLETHNLYNSSKECSQGLVLLIIFELCSTVYVQFLKQTR